MTVVAFPGKEDKKGKSEDKNSPRHRTKDGKIFKNIQRGKKTFI